MTGIETVKLDSIVAASQRKVYRDFTQQMLLIGAAVCLIIGDNRFWISISTWMNGAGSLIAGFAVILSGLFLVVNCARTKTAFRAEPLFPVFLYLSVVGLWARFGLDGSVITNRDIALALPIYAILNLNREDKIRLLYSIAVVFSIAMGLSAVYFLLRYCGASVPHIILEPSNPLKIAQGMHYEISMFGGSLLNRYGTLVYCGVFDEAGCIGTFAALILIAINECKAIDLLPHSRILKIALLLEGALSFSFAFFLIIVGYLVIYLFRKGDAKKAAAVVALLIAVFLIMVADPENLGALGSLQTRLTAFFSGEGILNNRVNAQTDAIMRSFYTTNDLFISLFGFGKSAFNEIAMSSGVDGCSVELYLYDYGYIGITLYYSLIIIFNRYSGKSLSGCWTPLLFFLVSTYQRPEVMTSLYLAILMLSFIPALDCEERFVGKVGARTTFGRPCGNAIRKEAA